jgi:hypothetical protein
MSSPNAITLAGRDHIGAAVKREKRRLALALDWGEGPLSPSSSLFNV